MVAVAFNTVLVEKPHTHVFRSHMVLIVYASCSIPTLMIYKLTSSEFVISLTMVSLAKVVVQADTSNTSLITAVEYN